MTTSNNPERHPERDVEEIDLETWCAEHPEEPPPKARIYVIRVDRQRFRLEKSHLSGKELLALVGHCPTSHKLYFKPRGRKPERVSSDEHIDFRRPGIERFQTVPCDAKEGLQRRQFPLLPEDKQALNDRGLSWETILEGHSHWLLVHDYPVATGLTHRSVTAAFLIPDGYADVQLDMVYVLPPLAREDGRPIGALSSMMIDGRTFQRWSRHRTPQNPWRIGIDGLDTHLMLVDDWFEREGQAA